jgi:signal transduction histidine kinase/CheY-like chemotaxis protein
MPGSISTRRERRNWPSGLIHVAKCSGSAQIRTYTRGVDARVLKARQIRLYIETSALQYLAAVASAVALCGAVVYQFSPALLPEILLWSTAIGATLLARLVAWAWYLRARPADETIEPWLKWFAVPQVCAVCLIASGPLFMLPDPSGRDVEVMFTLTFLTSCAALASSIKLSAYRPLIPLALVPMVLLHIAGTLPLAGAVPKLLAIGGVLAGLWGYRLSANVNGVIVRSLVLSMHNEKLALAAERAERDKTRFLAAASHDLRQPMHAISLMVGLLRPRATGAEREVVERLERSIESLDALFDTILDLSKLDAGVVKPAIAEVPLRALFESIEMHFAPQAAAKQLALAVFPTRAIAATDRAVLERLLRNLISNAIKYTPRGKVLIGCRRRGGRLRIGVWDTGIGIAPENLGRVFEEYFQASARPRDRSEGLGLGLSIVKRLARLLGSEVEVASTPGRGSCFSLEVPFAGYAGAPVPAHADAGAAYDVLAGKYILVIDDEPDVRFGTESVLRQWGCRSASAGSLDEIAALLERELRFPDAIVADFQLGAGTGLEAIAAVHAYSGERTPALIVTGEDLGRAEVEADGRRYPVLRKPVAPEELRRRLVAALGMRADSNASRGEHAAAEPSP